MVAINSTSIFFQSLFTLVNITLDQEESASYNYYYMKIGQESNATKCYGIYGCFQLSSPWTSEHRPVSLFPESIEKVEPKLIYYSRENPLIGTQFDLNDHEVIQSSGIDPLIPLYLVSHGYMEGGEVPWIQAMTKSLLEYEHCSVIVVDWEGGSSPPYTQAVANIRLVGAITAHLLAEFAQYTGDLKLDHVHCIGHSLGAHMSGYIGYTLQDDFGLKLGRISGLDPAEPHFAKAARPVRLDKSAAKFVDIVHTDASQFIRGGLGMVEPIGHIDYYPNGGTDQPGCGKSVTQYAIENGGSLFRGIKKFLGCNHIRAHELFSESIATKCPYTSIACNSYEEFKNGKCFDCGQHGEYCLQFGFHSRKDYIKKRIVNRKNQGIITYFLTGENKPYCKAHYKVKVKISNSPESKVHGGEIGQLWFIIHDTTDKKGRNTDRVSLNSGGYHEPGAEYNEIVPANAISHMRSVEVEWAYNSNVLNPLTWRLLASPRLHVAQIEIVSLEARESITVCPKNNKPLISGIPQLMLPSYCN